ncbi:MAG: YlxR family protein [Candidatus Eremiobacteraeota bacterium]|nr:YlxR family protein [Candidatus Eremiobacteraeota bacterium]
MSPQRTCVGCRTALPQPALRRFTRRDGRWVADTGRRSEGRGVYLCSRECAERVAKNKRYPGFSMEALLQW